MFVRALQCEDDLATTQQDKMIVAVVFLKNVIGANTPRIRRLN
jgi:hypothetical protein